PSLTDSLVKDQRAEETSRFSQTRQDHSVSVKRFLYPHHKTVNTKKCFFLHFYVGADLKPR
ncbi:hypothetical protein, partial [Acetobacter orientalis]|uniref:hypothetical protein n=1 Tax=Acetobacter orientalis TaxID=146474 RepID=UPI00248D440C